VRVEIFFEEYPLLKGDEEAVVDLVYHEIRLREENGETDLREEYLGRFPKLAARLAPLFEVHAALKAGSAFDPDATIPGKKASPQEAREILVPGYEILGEIGRGGMGVVYKARQEGLERLVALKMILAGSHAGPDELLRFRVEAETVARLQHPNVVQVYQVGEQDGLPYLSLEFVNGENLDTKLGGMPQPPREAAALLEKVARAIHKAHEHGVVHRDLKPGNILITEDGEPKVTDFGLAKRLDVDMGQTRTGTIMGAPAYMAPEQAAGKSKEIGPAADIYALGVILYEMLTGRPPFQGTTVLETLDQVRLQEPISPKRLQPKLPRELETICLKCLEKAPNRRYPTAQELADDLGRFLAGEPIKARHTAAWERAIKWAKRKPMAASFLGAIVLGTLGVFLSAAIAWGQRNRAVNSEVKLREQYAQSLADAGQLAVRRGNWREALNNYDLALEAGHPDTVGLRLGKIRAWLAINDAETAVEQVEALAGERDLGDYAGQVALLQGDLVLGIDDAKATRFIRQALALKLPAAQEAYAQGLLSENTLTAMKCFERTIETDPYHRDARALRGLLLLTLGRADEAKMEFHVSQALFPEDPTFQVFQALLAAQQRNFLEATRILESARGQLGEADTALLIAALEVWKSVDNWDEVLFGNRPLEAVALIAKIVPMLERFRLGAFDLENPKQMKTLPRLIRLPPAVARELSQGVALAIRFATTTTVKDTDIDELKRVLHTHPEGTLHYFHAMMLALSRRNPEAANAYSLAAATPALLPIRRSALDGAILMEGWAGSPIREKPDLEMRQRAAEHLRERINLGPLGNEYLSASCKVALYADDLELARRVLSQWEKHTPTDVEYLKFRATTELKAGAYGQAITAAQRVLAAQPKDSATNQLLKEALEKYRQEGEALGASTGKIH
jgi:tetratricopeptide (TPR) repeat protein/predicted Ser/Thr protein kinase